MSRTAPARSNEFQVAVNLLKRSLKAQRITYAELARGIGMSESGLKKLLSASDGSLQRLAQICRYVGVSMSALFQTSEESAVSFTPKQQEYLLRDPSLFYFYWKLVYERVPLKELAKEWRLSDKESRAHLKELAALKLLRMLPEGKLRIPSVKPVSWVDNGPFVRKLYKQWAGELMQKIASPSPGEGKLFLLRYLKMSEKTYADFTQALRSVESEFLRRAVIEMQTKPEALRHVQWVMGIGNESFVPSPQMRGKD